MTDKGVVTRGTAEAQALWYTRRMRCEIKPAATNWPQSGEVLVDALFSGVSRGTEGLVFRGEVPKSEWQRMRAPFQSGDFPFPVKYGYASIGKVREGDPDSLVKSYFRSTRIKVLSLSRPMPVCRFLMVFRQNVLFLLRIWKQRLTLYGTENHHLGITSAWSVAVLSVS